MRAISFLTKLFLGGCLLLGLLWPASLRAQGAGDDAPRLRPVTDWLRLSVDEGLPSEAVTVIRQDNQGFIWVGTRGGLSRFDGQEVVTYLHDPTDPNSLASNGVQDILVDRTGHLWVTTAGAGVSRLDPATATFTHYAFEPDNPNSLGGPLVTSLYEDRAGNLWFGGPRDSGLTRLEPATGRFTRYYPQPKQPDGYVGDLIGEIHEDAAGHLWFVADTSLVAFDPATERFTSYLPDETERRLNSLVPAPDGGWWVAGLGGLYHFDPADGSFETVEGITGPMAHLLLTEGALWVGSRTEGLYKADPLTGRVLQHHTPRSSLLSGFPGGSVTALFEDAGGVLWAGTANAGAVRTLLLAERFQSYRYDPTQPEALALGGVSALSGADANTLWLGAGNSLQKLERATGRVTRYPLATAQQRVEAVHVDRSGVVWVGTATPDALYRLDPAVGELEPFELGDPRPRRQPPRLMVAIEETPDGALWVAAQRDALYRIAPDREEVTRYEPDETLAPLLPEGGQMPAVLSLASTPDGTLWIGYSADGITRRDPDGRFHHLLLGRDVGSIVDMLVTADGSLWLVSTLQGLLLVEPGGETAQLPLVAGTIPPVQSIAADAAGYLWLGTQNGLVHYQPEQGTVERFVKHDGLQGNQFSSGAAWHAPDGWLFFGGTDGLTAFDPRTIAPDMFQPRPVLTTLRRYNEPVTPGAGGLLAQALWATQRLTLAHDEDVITLEFAGLGYADPEQLRYRYRLDGFEATWNEVGNRRFATYTNLPAGSYEFQVQVSNHDGQWSEQIATLALVVQPPWWETVWFRGGAVVALLLTGAAGYHWRVRAMRQRTLDLEAEITRRTEELAEQRARVAALEERERIGRDLHDDLGQIIGYVTIQAQSALALLEQANPDEVRAVLNQLVEATRLAHDNVRQYILGIRQASERPVDLLASLEAYVAHLEAEWGLRVQLSYPEALRTGVLTPAVETQLLRIVQEALTNVRKHADAPGAQVLLSLHSDSVQAIVSDQGRGFETDAAAQAEAGDTYFGLLIMQERAHSLGGEVEVRSAPGSGTQIFVRLPRVLPATLREEATGVRVLLVDDHPLYLEGLNTLLSTRGFQVVGLARDGLEAQEMVAQFRPDLVLMDVEMPRCDGLEATQRIKAAYPETKIVMLTVAATEQRLFGALRAGASGYLLKRLDATQFFALLGEVLRGEIILSPSLAGQLLEAFDAEEAALPDEPPERAEARARLTSRQREVLTYLAQGLSNREIAEVLYVTEPTVKYHVSQILERLQVATRQEAARYAERSNLDMTSEAD